MREWIPGKGMIKGVSLTRFVQESRQEYTDYYPSDITPTCTRIWQESGKRVHRTEQQAITECLTYLWRLHQLDTGEAQPDCAKPTAEDLAAALEIHAAEDHVLIAPCCDIHSRNTSKHIFCMYVRTYVRTYVSICHVVLGCVMI